MGIEWQTYELMRLTATDGLKLLRHALGLPEDTPTNQLDPLRELGRQIRGARPCFAIGGGLAQRTARA